jgi:hypothetical protein
MGTNETRVRFPSPAHLPVKTGLKMLFRIRKSERGIRHLSFSAFDSPFPAGSPMKKQLEADLVSESGSDIRFPRWKPA